MRKLAVLTFISLDGVMQAPKLPEEDRSGDFQWGGWAEPYWDEVMAQVVVEAMDEPYDVLFGRNTYEVFAAHANDDHPMRHLKKFVVCSETTPLVWENSTCVTGDIPSEVAKLKHQDGPLLQVHGSWQLIQTLFSEDLVDELRLWTFPVVLGQGKRLFAGGTMPTEFQLIKSAPTTNGVTMSIYRRKYD